MRSVCRILGYGRPPGPEDSPASRYYVYMTNTDVHKLVQDADVFCPLAAPRLLLLEDNAKSATGGLFKYAEAAQDRRYETTTRTSAQIYRDQLYEETRRTWP